MASLGATFANLFDASSDPANADATGKERSAHYNFINSQVLPLTTKLQREMRGRKFKDVQGKLKSSIESLKEFRNEEWPPASSNDNDLGNQEQHRRHRRHQPNKQVSDDPLFGRRAPVEAGGDDQIDNNELDDMSIRSEATATTRDTTSTVATGGLPEENYSHVMNDLDDMSVQPDRPPMDNSHDDPNTRQENMHDAVVEAMEAYIFVLVHPYKSVKAIELSLECVQLFVSKRYVSGRAGGQDDASGSGAKMIEMWHQHGIELPPPSLLHQLIEAVTKCSESTSENVQNGLVKTMTAILASPKCGVHEASMLLGLRSVLHVYLVTKTSAVRESSKIALMDVIRSVFGRMEAYQIMLNNSSNNNNNVNTGTALAAQLHTDSYVLFRSLCKLSSKDLPEDGHYNDSSGGSGSGGSIGGGMSVAGVGLFHSTPTVDPMALRNKILSLELILSVMELCGDAFCNGEKFIYLVQHYLCVSLLKNCMSNHTQVAFLSQKIFLILVYKFKGNLKQEIEVFMSNIFLRVLESPNSSFQQKALVLESLRSLCKDPVLLTQIFLNYDCDFDAMNLYKDIVHNLTKLSGKTTSSYGSNQSDKKGVDEQYELSLAGVEVIVTILKAFLKASGLPGGEEIHNNGGDDDTAGAKIRGMLQLDVGPAAQPEPANNNKKGYESGDDDSVVILGGMSENNIIHHTNRNFGNTREMGSTVAHDNLLGSASERPAGKASSDAAVKIVDAFDRKRNAEQNFEMGVVKFTLNLKKGLNFFIDNGFVVRDAKQIALFFLASKDKLDKTQIGEALGREPDSALVKGDDVDPEVGGPGFWVRVLHHYANSMDFTGLLFDEAIRLFLSGFRLPGEAQKIDRIMEKFAERFTLQNPTVFATADTAFILAFSVIMLNTDLHNPSIKPERRMTLESFINNNRGIGENGSNLPDEFLKGIFDRIKKKPFSLKEDDAAREAASKKSGGQHLDGGQSMFLPEGAASFFGQSSEERKRERFKKEREEMMAATAQLIRRRKSGNQGDAEASRLTDAVDPADVIKPMFDVTWGPVIGILSQVLECSEDARSITVCLNGFVYAIRLASHSNMSLARDTFVTSLAKFTFLGSLKEMKRKNIESIRTLLSIAVMDGEFLVESWGPVLQCISQLARLRMSASGLDSDESFLTDSSGFQPGSGRTRPSMTSQSAMKKANAAGAGAAADAPASRAELMNDNSAYFKPSSREMLAKETQEYNGRFVLEAVNEVLIDKVFSSTVNLSAHSLAHFIEQLINVSQSEIAGTTKSGITGVSSPPASLGGVKGKSGKTSENTGMDSSTSGSNTKTSANSTANSSTNNNANNNNSDGPSIFSLQRLVEVADYNMDVRPRLVWAQLWPKIADYFATIGSHENPNISVFAIDSLKQLSFKFLDKPELSEFNFQRIFLSPFLRCLEDETTREEIGELVLRCLDNIVRTKSHNLRSGWKIIFSILTRAANDRRENIKFLGLSILQRLLDEHLHQLCSKASGSSHNEHVDRNNHDINEGGENHALTAATADSDGVLDHGQEEEVVCTARTINSDAEDFVGLCRASLAFVQSEETDSPRPSGLSMRALCHTAIYADILGDHIIRPPVSGAQFTDPAGSGYTYKDLDEKESLEMVLWRPLFEGLADGIRAPMKSWGGGRNAGGDGGDGSGVGCLIQRGSILALRSILIRHGHIFSVTQWKVILEQTLLPAIQNAAENDESPVLGITSEAPSVSSIDFLASSLPVPPPINDSGLKKFEKYANPQDTSETKRPFGPAELLLEASFTDMRHGGDGNLRRAYLFARKDIKAKTIEQPFPNSWVATTSPVALGLLTDIASEIILTRGAGGRDVLWPVIAKQYDLWCVGSPAWRPCEALVRVAIGECNRFSNRVVKVLPKLEKEEAVGWTAVVVSLYSDILSKSVAHERTLRIVSQKAKKKGQKSKKSKSKDKKEKTKETDSSPASKSIDTPYGKGTLLKERVDKYADSSGKEEKVIMRVCKLEFGALLYSPSPSTGSSDDSDNFEKSEPILTHDAAIEWVTREFGPKSPRKKGDSVNAYLLDIVAALKIRCVSAHCLQQSLLGTLNGYVPWIRQVDVSSLMETLSYSRRIAEQAVQDEDLKLVFQEAIVSEWGDGVEEVERALSNVARLSHLHGSDMFFLTQEAGATKAMFRILSLLMHGWIRRKGTENAVTDDGSDDGAGWSERNQQYAEPLLLQTVKDVLQKFLDSEKRDGHLIDVNVWRNTSENGAKVALYCTTFAAVVEDILKMMLSLKPEKFERQKHIFFPVICSLVRVQSEEIRSLVQQILSVQVASMIGVETEQNGKE